MFKAEYDKQTDSYIFACPHCDNMIQVQTKDINCRIFRHGVFKQSQQALPPHASKEMCDKAVASLCLLGCGKPFEMVQTGETSWVVNQCEYK